MSTIVYSGSVSEATGLNQSPSVSLSGSGSASGVVNSVTAMLSFSTNAYGTTYNVTATLNYSGGSKTSTVAVKMDSSNYTNGQFSFVFDGLTAEQANSISSISVTSSNDPTKIYLRGNQTVTVDYSVLSNCGAPTNLELSANNVGFSQSVTLSWTAGSPGENVPVAGYQVYRGNTSLGTTMSTSFTVTSPNSNSSYTYKVKTLASVAGYDSGFSDEITLTSVVSACEAPESVTLDATNAAPGAKVTLSWSGAKAGTNNPIRGYQVYRSAGAETTYNLLSSVSATDTSGSLVVSAPTANGTTYCYKVVTVGSQSGYDSEQSVVYAELTCSYSAVSTPTSISVSLTNVAPSTIVTLSWAGAAHGVNNSITGYNIYRSESESGPYTLIGYGPSNATYGSVQVMAPAANGATYYHKVETISETAGYNSGLSDVYAALTCSYTAPTAPKSVAIREGVTAYVFPGTVVELTWLSATAGANNAITGYDVYRDGTLLVSDLSPATRSYEVTSHSQTGKSYVYTVVTKGEYSDSINSNACTLYSYTDPTAPTAINAPVGKPPAGSRFMLSWSGATPGGYNAIVGYKVYRSTMVSGTYTLVASVDSTSTSASCYVSAPPRADEVFYYRVETVGSYSTSGRSNMYAFAKASEPVDFDDADITVIVPPKPPRKKRGMVFGEYDTAVEGWTLTEWSFEEPEAQTYYVDVPGRSAGPIDMSTALTNGDPRYQSRTLYAQFECSEGNRLTRNALISDMVNRLHGRRDDIILPDDEAHYVTGRLSVLTKYSDPAHASVTVEAVCDPWRYSKTDTQIELTVLNTESQVVLSNSGRRVVSPEITVSGYGARVTLVHGSKSWTLTTGTHHLSGFSLPTGNTVIHCSGYGTVTFTYREAIL